MNINILLISAGMVALSSCSSAYKTSQTPDDMYYSAPKEAVAAGNGSDDEYVAVNNKKDRYSAQRQNQDNYDNYDSYETYRNDRWLRMSIGNPYYLSTYNNYYWNDWNYSSIYSSYGLGYNSYGYGGIGFGGGFGYSPWGSSMYWNSFYNPYAFNYNPYGYGHIGIVPSTSAPVYRNTARPTVFNPRAYGSSSRSSNVNTARTYYNPRTGGYSNYNNTNGNRVSTGNNTRRSSDTYYNNNNNSARQSNTYYPSSSNNTSSSPSRTYTPSSSGSSGNSGGGSRGGSSGGGAPSRPTRN